MTKRILVDAAHPEEVRVAVAEDSKLIEFEFETAEKKQIKNNIYLGKITRVEPSLQAAFVEYGGNKQGFLPFSEIHFDYYQIPTEDKKKLKQMLLDEKAAKESFEDEKEELEARKQQLQKESSEEKTEIAEAEPEEKKPNKNDRPARGKRDNRSKRFNREPRDHVEIPEGFSKSDLPDLISAHKLAKVFAYELMGDDYVNETFHNKSKAEAEEKPIEEEKEVEPIINSEEQESKSKGKDEAPKIEEKETSIELPEADNENDIDDSDSGYNQNDFYKKYKIQEVIKRNQVVLVQVLKEERGNKGATISTYVSLAGRFSVFMPNTEKGGGVSRRISSFTERKRIRDVIKKLDVPQGSSIIVRTAGAEKSEEEIKADYDYTVSAWNDIREETMSSSAPCLIYQESDIVRRTIRDLFKGDVEEMIIDGKEHYKNAAKFMEIVAPNQKDSIKLHKSKIPIFQKYKIEDRLDELYEHEVRLESGGSIVISPTEALVAIDVNSGKATKERSVEDTAIKTNIEAAKEIARQLKLRDLAGLIVIDFIDMRDIRNRKAVERELKDALKNDRAKIQVGRISAFGLLEMSRQRLHSSLIESSSNSCQMCNGLGVVRSMDSTTLKVLRSIEAESGRRNVSNVTLKLSSAIYTEIKKRISDIKAIESRDNVKIVLEEHIKMLPNQFDIKLGDGAGKGKGKKDKERERPNLSKGNGNTEESTDGSDNLGNSEDYKSDKPKNNRDRKPRRNTGRKNSRNSNYKGNRDKGNFNAEGNNTENDIDAGSNVTNIDNAGNKGTAQNPDDDKSSKLMGLWKKITG